jgi:polar amino acid transport system substrate-binding protein
VQRTLQRRSQARTSQGRDERVRRRRRLPGHAGPAALCLSAAAALVLLTAAPVGASPHAHLKLKPPAILQAGELQFCSTITTPPVEYYTANHTPTGTDVELGSAIAEQLGLKPVWLNIEFTNIIPSLQAGHCDLIMSDLYIKSSRLKVVNMIPYMWASESVVVKEGNPSHITGMNLSLCGRRVAANFSTTAVEDAQADSADCVKAGKKAITITQFKTPIAALQQLGLGRATAFATTTENGAYYMAQRKGIFQFAGPSYGRILAGIAINKGDGALESAVVGALKTLYCDHTYARIFARFGLAQEELLKLLPARS